MKVLIAIPVLNEARILRTNILKISSFCRANLEDDWQLIIADNGSTDETEKIGQDLADEINEIKYLRLNKKGKGLAIKSAWQNFEADVYGFMDADLATDLSALPEAINQIRQGYDVVVGSRFEPASVIKRSLGRTILSRGYRLIARFILGTKIKDLPCGFKFINQRMKQNILPQVQDESWFFDSELIILAENNQYKIKQLPVIWQDVRSKDDRTRIKIISLSFDYLKKLIKLRRRLLLIK